VIVDYHMHLRGPGPGPEEGPIEHTAAAVEAYVDAAAAHGVDEIGFTEHLYYFRQFEGLVTHPYQRDRMDHDLETYVDAVVESKSRGLPVKLALEVDWFQGREEELARALEPYPWDYLVGSVHIVDGEAIDLEPGAWEHRSVGDVWHRYFDQLRALARSRIVDVLAHPDLVKIFGRRPAPEQARAQYQETVDVLEECGVAVEVSSAGLHRPVGEIYPAPEFLALCRERGVAATTASDAHLSQNVGRDLDRAVEHLLQAGYDTITVFDGREARQEHLG
jgi:histidinol-phosphatase (PHP family)